MTINHDGIDAEIDMWTISYLSAHYNSEDDLLNDFYNLFNAIGVHDEKLIHKCMVGIFRSKITPTSIVELEEKQNEIIEEIREASKIKLNNSIYILLSDAYVKYLTWHYTLNEEKIIPDEEIEDAINAIDEIFSAIGRIYSLLASCSTVSSETIQSLGGKNRAKKYDAYKSEIFTEWEQGNFHSYSKCARTYSDKFDLNPKTIETWLSKKYKKS
ncbi:hypothetical protein [Acinetobacter modestus]|uniref:Uncharacterized protein n=1 Tax=Acinetobacter modestus TaxID=1776740 RepID=A0ABN0JR82_9GAMM|nr:hypothetical protein [Acinetobacter modestus]ENU27944.1 hypothetical protein F992_00776 [Acinetobacter modestus]GGA21299.1 hypothetical protein GCM10017554_17900 [Acinetobacter modestus]